MTCLVNHPAGKRFTDESDQQAEELDGNGDGGLLPKDMILGERWIERFDPPFRADFGVAQRRYFCARQRDRSPQKRRKAVNARKPHESQPQTVIQ